MLCLVHGYGLTGSGSNQWTRSIAQGLCEIGETIHVVCQENRPEQFDFVSEVYTYDRSGQSSRLLERSVELPGRCILHRPQLDILPTYVRPQSSNAYMASILDLPHESIDDYLERNIAAMRRILTDNDISAVQVNHVVLMAVAVHRTCKEMGIPFGILPHGSAIEYVVKHDQKMHEIATAALTDADRIFTLSDELRERIQDVFPEVPDPVSKMVDASAGVDTRQFRIVERSERSQSIDHLKEILGGGPRGKSSEQRGRLRKGLHDDMSLNDLLGLMNEVEDYPPKQPDEGVERLLDQVDWQRDDVITFVGKLIGYKGLPSLVAAFPSIAARRPNSRLLIAGRGNLRPGLEALVYALGDGKRKLVEKIVEWGGAVEGEAPAPFERVARYLEQLRRSDELDAYFEHARRYATPERIIFTGYLEHHLLCHLFPCCDVAIFPSIVKEAAPLVVPEAMASGCFPVGTDFAGMGASLDVAAQAVPEDVGKLMRLRPEPEHTIRDMVENVSTALEVTDRYRSDLRRVAVDRYDWRSVARGLADAMQEMAASHARA